MLLGELLDDLAAAPDLYGASCADPAVRQVFDEAATSTEAGSMAMRVCAG